MKKIFTLAAVALMAASVNAQTTWKTPKSANEDGTAIIEAETVLAEDDDITVKTVYASKASNSEQTFCGESFDAYFQVRVAADPTDDNLTGTAQKDNTPLVITVKKDLSLTVYYRRQKGENGFNADDNKDLLAINQNNPDSKKGIVNGTLEIGIEDGDYAFCSKTYELDANNTYTLFRKGSTLRIYGFTYKTGGSTDINGITAEEANENAPVYNLAGQRVNKNAKGILIQNGKKFIKK